VFVDVKKYFAQSRKVAFSTKAQKALSLLILLGAMLFPLLQDVF
jgi:hypothetical protein